MAENNTDTQANITSGDDGSKTQAGVQGAGTQPANGTEGAGVAQPETYTKKQVDGMMAQVRVAVQKEFTQKAEQEKLAAQGEWQKIAEQKDAELKTHQAELRTARLEARVAALAAQKHITDTDALFRLLKDDVEFADDGTPTNLEALVDNWLTKVPGLASTGEPAQDSAQPQGPPLLPTGLPANTERKRTLTLEQIQHMTREQINENWEEVQRVMASQNGAGVKI